MTWPLADCYSNHFGRIKRYFSWWCWLTIFSYCSRSTSWGQRNTDSRSRLFVWSTSFWPGRKSKQQVAWWRNSRKNIHIERSMNTVCLDETHLHMFQIVLPFKLSRINYIGASDMWAWALNFGRNRRQPWWTQPYPPRLFDSLAK